MEKGKGRKYLLPSGHFQHKTKLQCSLVMNKTPEQLGTFYKIRVLCPSKTSTSKDKGGLTPASEGGGQDTVCVCREVKKVSNCNGAHRTSWKDGAQA